MSDQPTLTLVESPAPVLSAEAISNAARNDYGDSFVLGGRSFEVKDLDYDSYIEFARLVSPIMSTVASAVHIDTDEKGVASVGFNAGGVDANALIDMCGKDLPKLAWLCCKQSDPKIKIDEVKRLGRRPWDLLQVVLFTAKRLKLVEEFSKAFPLVVTSLTDLVPSSMTGATPSSS